MLGTLPRSGTSSPPPQHVPAVDTPVHRYIRRQRGLSPEAIPLVLLQQHTVPGEMATGGPSWLTVEQPPIPEIFHGEVCDDVDDWRTSPSCHRHPARSEDCRYPGNGRRQLFRWQEEAHCRREGPGHRKVINVRNGYDFITRSDTREDIFVYRRAMARNNAPKRMLRFGAGERVQFDILVGDKDHEPANVTALEGKPVQSTLYAANRRHFQHCGFHIITNEAAGERHAVAAERLARGSRPPRLDTITATAAGPPCES
ncbi:hypothetical protein HPB51_008023 [Rhipicephalus microplus]|uniref:CSD domain-containing protein n=1 Tax=Rhipicephalus microplus TaxID=6941 RepID=A0A9J6EGB8_RHIMP|nr:hypothetical protein HPB51_008023 [Rhipicephalus microplus]